MAGVTGGTAAGWGRMLGRREARAHAPTGSLAPPQCRRLPARRWLAGEVRLLSSGASPISPEVFDFLRICFGATGECLPRCLQICFWGNHRKLLAAQHARCPTPTSATLLPLFPCRSTGGLRHDRNQLPHLHDAAGRPQDRPRGTALPRL